MTGVQSIFAIARQHISSRLAVALVAVMLIFIGNALYRNKTSDLWTHPDQEIPVKVLEGMRHRGDLNTDWAKADLPGYFQACRYNFSGYLLFAYVTTSTFSSDAFANSHSMVEDLQRFSRIFSALTLALVFVLLARHLGILYGLAGAVSVAAVPQLFQDAHYARPEALATFCFTLCFALASLRPQGTVQRSLSILALSVLTGFLASIKVTFVVTALFAVPVAMACFADVQQKNRLIGELLRLSVLFACGATIGFAIGAPAAIADPRGFLAGLTALREQYAGIHPPHSHMESGVLVQGGSILRYYIATLGPIILGVHLAGYLGRTLAPAKYAYAAVLAITLAGFLWQNVFFERNFSPLIPTFIVIAICGIASIGTWLARVIPQSNGHATAAGILSLCLFMASQLVPFSVTYNLTAFFSRDNFLREQKSRQERIERAKRQSGASAIHYVSFPDVFAEQWPRTEGCTLYAAEMFGDDWSARYMRELPSQYHSIDVIPSEFESVPTSTLQTYHSPSVYLFIDTSRCPARA